MNRKQRILLFISSFLIFILPLLLGGYGGHHIKFLVAALLYSLTTYYFLGFAKNKKQELEIICVILALPLLIYIPLHVQNFNLRLLSFPSTLSHFWGILFGFLFRHTKKGAKSALLIFFLSSCLYMTFWGYHRWLNYLNYGNFTGIVDQAVPQFKFTDKKGGIISNTNSKKILILDFWNTSCGACFVKFPALEKLYLKYKNSTDVAVYAINYPLKTDSAWEAFDVIETRNYTFPVLKTAGDDFKIKSFPTVVIVNDKGRVIFKGDIDDVEAILSKL